MHLLSQHQQAREIRNLLLHFVDTRKDKMDQSLALEAIILECGNPHITKIQAVARGFLCRRQHAPPRSSPRIFPRWDARRFSSITMSDFSESTESLASFVFESLRNVMNHIEPWEEETSLDDESVQDGTLKQWLSPATKPKGSESDTPIEDIHPGSDNQFHTHHIIGIVMNSPGGLDTPIRAPTRKTSLCTSFPELSGDEPGNEPRARLPAAPSLEKPDTVDEGDVNDDDECSRRGLPTLTPSKDDGRRVDRHQEVGEDMFSFFSKSYGCLLSRDLPIRRPFRTLSPLVDDSPLQIPERKVSLEPEQECASRLRPPMNSRMMV
jgi:hypothetical protein